MVKLLSFLAGGGGGGNSYLTFAFNLQILLGERQVVVSEVSGLMENDSYWIGKQRLLSSIKIEVRDHEFMVIP